MATKISIGGKIVTRPGVYATTKSGIKNPSPQLSYGNIVIIDDGIGASWGGGAGVGGELSSGVNSVYELNTIEQFRAFVKGGELWNIAKPLFIPAEKGTNGVSKVFLIRAASTTSASISYSLTNGSFTLKTLDEGINANGALTNGILTKGYATVLIKSPINSNKYILQFYAGTFKGIDPLNGVPYDNISLANSTASLVMSSPECGTVQDIVNWCNSSKDFKAAFQLVSSEISSNTSAEATVVTSSLTALVGKVLSLRVTDPQLGPITLGNYTVQTGDTALTITTAFDTAVNAYGKGYSSVIQTNNLVITAPISYGAEMNGVEAGIYHDNGVLLIDFAGGISSPSTITDQDVTDNAGYNLAAGATESYSSANFTAAIEAIKDIDNTFFLATSYGITAGKNLNNTKIFDYIQNDSKYEKFMVVGGGANQSEFAGSTDSTEAICKYYNSDKVIVVHGNGKETSKSGFLVHSSLYKAAGVLGRVCGLTPQTPLTFKSIGIDGDVHVLNDSEKEHALAIGAVTTQFDSELGYYVIQQGINTLQKNDYLVNEDASSFSVAVKRIEAQLNKELSISIKKTFFGDPTSGPNRNTVSEQSLISHAKGFLSGKVASTQADNLILSYGNVAVTTQGDVRYLTYEFTPNFEVNKIVITGTIIEG
jgi:hypothetical protein